jgi:hypothetical protein
MIDLKLLLLILIIIIIIIYIYNKNKKEHFAHWWCPSSGRPDKYSTDCDILGSCQYKWKGFYVGGKGKKNMEERCINKLKDEGHKDGDAIMGEAKLGDDDRIHKRLRYEKRMRDDLMKNSFRFNDFCDIPCAFGAYGTVGDESLGTRGYKKSNTNFENCRDKCRGCFATDAIKWILEIAANTLTIGGYSGVSAATKATLSTWSKFVNAAKWTNKLSTKLWKEMNLQDKKCSWWTSDMLSGDITKTVDKINDLEKVIDNGFEDFTYEDGGIFFLKWISEMRKAWQNLYSNCDPANEDCENTNVSSITSNEYNINRRIGIPAGFCLPTGASDLYCAGGLAEKTNDKDETKNYGYHDMNLNYLQHYQQDDIPNTTYSIIKYILTNKIKLSGQDKVSNSEEEVNRWIYNKIEKNTNSNQLGISSKNPWHVGAVTSKGVKHNKYVGKIDPKTKKFSITFSDYMPSYSTEQRTPDDYPPEADIKDWKKRDWTHKMHPMSKFQRNRGDTDIPKHHGYTFTHEEHNKQRTKENKQLFEQEFINNVYITISWAPYHPLDSWWDKGVLGNKKNLPLPKKKHLLHLENSQIVPDPPPDWIANQKGHEGKVPDEWPINTKSNTKSSTGIPRTHSIGENGEDIYTYHLDNPIWMSSKLQKNEEKKHTAIVNNIKKQINNYRQLQIKADKIINTYKNILKNILKNPKSSKMSIAKVINTIKKKNNLILYLSNLIEKKKKEKRKAMKKASKAIHGFRTYDSLEQITHWDVLNNGINEWTKNNRTGYLNGEEQKDHPSGRRHEPNIYISTKASQECDDKYDVFQDQQHYLNLCPTNEDGYKWRSTKLDNFNRMKYPIELDCGTFDNGEGQRVNIPRRLWDDGKTDFNSPGIFCTKSDEHIKDILIIEAKIKNVMGKLPGILTKKWHGKIKLPNGYKDWSQDKKDRFHRADFNTKILQILEENKEITWGDRYTKDENKTYHDAFYQKIKIDGKIKNLKGLGKVYSSNKRGYVIDHGYTTGEGDIIKNCGSKDMPGFVRFGQRWEDDNYPETAINKGTWSKILPIYGPEQKMMCNEDTFGGDPRLKDRFGKGRGHDNHCQCLHTIDKDGNSTGTEIDLPKHIKNIWPAYEPQTSYNMVKDGNRGGVFRTRCGSDPLGATQNKRCMLPSELLKDRDLTRPHVGIINKGDGK